MANNDDIIEYIIDDNGGVYNTNNMIEVISPLYGTTGFGATNVNESITRFNDVPGTITNSNENRSLFSKAASAVKSAVSFLPKGNTVLNFVASGLTVAGAAAASATGLGSVASEAVAAYGRNRNLNTVLTHITSLGNVGTTVGESIGGIFQDLRTGSREILGVVTNATELTSRILRMFYSSVPTDGLTIPTVTKYALYLIAMYYGTNMIKVLTRNSGRLVDGITDKILSILNGRNQVRTIRRIVHHNGKVPAHYNNNFIATNRSNYILNSRKNLQNRLLKQLSREQIINNMSMFLMEWLVTELNKEPQPTLIDILRQVPQQTATILKKIKPNITAEIQEDMKQYMLNMTPCDIIYWFYFSMSQLDNVPERVRTWIFQLPHCNLIDPQPWMLMPLRILLERPEPENYYKVPENNIPWDKMQEQLKQLLLSDQLSEQQQMAYQPMSRSEYYQME